MSVFWVTRMDQAALLADSFKLSILEQFAEEPRTARQVADRMNLKQTRLYRHIEALHKAGLLKVVREQQKRGTIEKYYQTVAKRFEFDSSMFATGSDQDNEALKMVRSMIRDTEKEVVPMLADYNFEKILEDELAPILTRVLMRGSRKEITLLRQKLLEWIEACSEDSAEGGADEPTISFRGLLMFYPLDNASD